MEGSWTPVSCESRLASSVAPKESSPRSIKEPSSVREPSSRNDDKTLVTFLWMSQASTELIRGANGIAANASVSFSIWAALRNCFAYLCFRKSVCSNNFSGKRVMTHSDAERTAESSNFWNKVSTWSEVSGNVIKSLRASPARTREAPIPTPATKGHRMHLPGSPTSTRCVISFSKKQFAAPYAVCPTFPNAATIDEKHAKTRKGSHSVSLCKM